MRAIIEQDRQTKKIKKKLKMSKIFIVQNRFPSYKCDLNNGHQTNGLD